MMMMMMMMISWSPPSSTRGPESSTWRPSWNITESPTLLPTTECCATKMTYSASGYPNAFYIMVDEADASITAQCPGDCVYVK